MIPLAATVSARFAPRRSFRLWIPFLLVWLILLPFLLVLFPVVFAVCLFVQINAFRLYLTAWQILSSMKDTRVEVESGEMAFKLRIV